MKFSELSRTSLDGNVKIPCVKDGANYGLTEADLRDLFVIQNQATHEAYLAAPLATHNWGYNVKYVGIRIGHLLKKNLHLDMDVEIHQSIHKRSCSAHVCLLVNKTGTDQTTVKIEGGEDVLTGQYNIRATDNGIWLVLELNVADALIHACATNLCAYFGWGEVPDSAEVAKFSNYQIALFSELPGTELTL